MWENAMKLLCKIDLDLFCLRVYEQRGRYLKLIQYLYPLRCVLLFTFSHIGHTYLGVKTIANAMWLVESHLHISCLFLVGCPSCIFMMFVNKEMWWRLLQWVVLVSTESCRLPNLLLNAYELLIIWGNLCDWSLWFLRAVMTSTGRSYSFL